jgi:hypothetical protein
MNHYSQRRPLAAIPDKSNERSADRADKDEREPQPGHRHRKEPPAKRETCRTRGVLGGILHNLYGNRKIFISSLFLLG